MAVAAAALVLATRAKDTDYMFSIFVLLALRIISSAPFGNVRGINELPQHKAKPAPFPTPLNPLRTCPL